MNRADRVFGHDGSRLVRAMAEKVEVDEKSSQVTAVLVDRELEDDDPLPGPTATNDVEKAEVGA